MFSGLTLIQQVFLWLDNTVFWFAEKAYDLLIDLTNVELFTESQFSDFSSRIYVLLAILMLFKLTFSLISYIVNPDLFTDKNKGIGKLVLNICVVLILLVSIPFIFDMGMKIQRLILTNNVIPNFFLGAGQEEQGDVISYESEGEYMAFMTLSVFYGPNPAIFNSDENKECRYNLFSGADNSDIREVIDSKHDIGNSDLVMRDECAEVLNAATGTSFDGQISDVLSYAYQDTNINILTDTDIIKAKSEIDGEKVATFNFHGIMALIAGGFLAWILVMFCFDIAVRLVKLAFLQLIAPIPIVTYAEPKSSGIFKKWVKQCLTTYFDLFIRLIAIFFALYVVQMLPEMYINVKGDVSDQSGGFIHNSLIYIFIIFGALLFAKQLPKLIENIIGVKLDGGFTLNPSKKLASVPGVAKTVGTAGAVYAGAKYGKESGHAFRGAVGGLLTGHKGVTEKDGFFGSFSKGANNVAKGMFGKDFKTWSVYDTLGGKKGAKAEMDVLKEKRNTASNAADLFRAQAEQAAQSGNQSEAERLFGKAARYKSMANVYSDQINSIKTQFRIDESAKADIRKADRAMADLATDSDFQGINSNVNNNNNSNNRNTGTGSDQQITERDARLMNADARVEWENSPNNPANRGRQQQ